MKSGRLYGTLVLTALMAQGVFGQQEKANRNRQRDYPPKLAGAKSEVYKTVGDTKLRIYVFEPEGHTSSDRRTAIVFFFGGGWNNGSPKQFEHHCRYLASRGMVALTADYRVRTRHGVRTRMCCRREVGSTMGAATRRPTRDRPATNRRWGRIRRWASCRGSRFDKGIR